MTRTFVIALLVLLVIAVLVAVYALRHYGAKKVIQQRLKTVARIGDPSSSLSILKKSSSGGLFTTVLARFDVLFSRSDKLLFALLFIALPSLGYYFVAALDWYWRVLGGFAAALLLLGAFYLVRQRQQSEAFEREITQVLGLMSRAVSAGLSVPQAIEQVAQSQSGLLGREFLLIQDQLSLGRSLRLTLNEACMRLPYKAFRYFCVALILNQSNGGQLREILHNLSRTLHDNRAMQKKIASLTSEPRMTARFLTILPFALLAIVAFLDSGLFALLIETETGQSVLLYCLVSIAIGALSLHMLTKNRRFL